MRRKLFYSACIFSLLSLIFMACAEESLSQKPVLSPSSLTLSVGETKEVSISGGVSPYTPYYTGNTISVKSYGSSLSVTGKKTGTASVAVTGDDGGSATLSVTVE